MSEIAATALTLGRQMAGDILALKLAAQQDQAVVALVQKALQPPEQAAGAAPASDRLVDIRV
jgi:hypothetical protein